VPHQRNVKLALQMQVIEQTQHMQLFTGESDEHSCVRDPCDNISVTLVRLIVNEYVNIRFYSMAKRITDMIKGKNVSFNSNKLVLFAHQ